jgi:hypothetical protein
LVFGAWERYARLAGKSSLRHEANFGEVYTYVSRKWSITHDHEWHACDSHAFSSVNLAARESVATTPYFLEHPEFGGDNGRDQLIGARSELRLLWKNHDLSERI